jgi:hypothetical protein
VLSAEYSLQLLPGARALNYDTLFGNLVNGHEKAIAYLAISALGNCSSLQSTNFIQAEHSTIPDTVLSW